MQTLTRDLLTLPPETLLLEELALDAIGHFDDPEHFLQQVLSAWFPRLFSYNFLVCATRMDDVDDILSRTAQES